MKRRKFFLLTSFVGLGIALGGNSFSKHQHSPKLKNCPRNIITTSPSFFRFAALGDIGTGVIRQYEVAKVMECYNSKNRFALVLLAGDNIYNNGEIERIHAVFEKPYRSLLKQDIPFYAVLGNHDIRTRNGEDQINYPQFNMQGRYYTFTEDLVQFFALDTNENTLWKQQLEWLEEKLASSQKPWKVVFGHHNLYSSGKYGVNQELIERLTPLFSRYGVQLYINGHEHHYERTIPIQGTTYLTCGAGATIRSVGKSSWTAYSASRLSFAVFEVEHNRLTIKGIDTDGQIFDHGEIFRS